MNIIIKGTNLELHNDLKEYVHEKIGGLKKFIENENMDMESVTARVELARTTRHHQHGEVYKAEVNLQLPGKMLRNVVESEDIYKSIDDVKDELREMINNYKGERIRKTRRGARMIKKLLHLSPMSWVKGEFKKIRRKRYKR
ncbi:MAG: ribosome-associated translation inhibitor RaiA [Patescibacteria group bacterium]|nr:ribosome-associated translation inhibitor RaiA [Patescibacteria group bacterium]